MKKALLSKWRARRKDVLAERHEKETPGKVDELMDEGLERRKVAEKRRDDEYEKKQRILVWKMEKKKEEENKKKEMEEKKRRDKEEEKQRMMEFKRTRGEVLESAQRRKQDAKEIAEEAKRLAKPSTVIKGLLGFLPEIAV